MRKQDIESRLHRQFPNATKTQVDRIRTYTDKVYVGEMTETEAIRRIRE